jgi:hypothetical protein
MRFANVEWHAGRGVGAAEARAPSRWLLGLAGTWALLPLLRALDVPRPSGLDSDGDLVAAALREAWGSRARDESAVLAAGGGRVWVVQVTDWAALRMREYAAIGEGEPFALGALHATRGLEPRARVMAALRAARTHCPSVGGRLRVHAQKGGAPAAGPSDDGGYRGGG